MSRGFTVYYSPVYTVYKHDTLLYVDFGPNSPWFKDFRLLKKHKNAFANAFVRKFSSLSNDHLTKVPTYSFK
jgi:hypothetical protein